MANEIKHKDSGEKRSYVKTVAIVLLAVAIVFSLVAIAINVFVPDMKVTNIRSVDEAKADNSQSGGVRLVIIKEE